MRLPIDKGQLRAISPAVVKVIMGIRPDNLQLQPASGNGDRLTGTISGTVEVVEPLGSTMDLHVRLADGHRLVCRVAAGPIECDAEVMLHVDLLKTHLFSAGDSNS